LRIPCVALVRAGIEKDCVVDVSKFVWIVMRACSLPNNFVLKIIFPENLVEHDLDVVAGVPVAVVIKAAGLLRTRPSST